MKKEKKNYRRQFKVEQVHPFFKIRGFKEKYWYMPNRTYTVYEHQCPACNRWFASYNTYSAMGLRLHISRTAKIEAVAKQLGELKKIPHFNFWEANTEPINALHKPREWKIY